MAKSKSERHKHSWFRKHWLLSLGALFLVFMLIGGVALWRFYQYYRSSERFIQLAETLRDEGEYRGALDQYGRALRYADSNSERVDILSSMIEAIKDRPSRVPREAQQAYYEVDSLRMQIIRLQPEKTEISDAMLKEHFELCQRLNAPWAWNQLEEIADTVLGFKEDHRLAHEYKTIAQLFTVSKSSRTKKFFREKYEELQEMLEEKPEDENLIYYTAIAQLKRAALFDQSYEQNRKNELIQEARKLISDYLAENSPSRHFKFYHIRFLLQEAMTTQDLDLVQKIYDKLRNLSEEIKGSDDKSLGSDVADLFVTLSRMQRTIKNRDDGSLIDATEDDIRQLALDLAENVSQAEPGNLEAKLTMARIYEEKNQQDKAVKLLENLLDPDYESPISTKALFDAHARFKARYELSDIYLTRCEMTEIDKQREELLAKVQNQLEMFKQGVGEDHPYVVSIEGRIAYLNNNYQEAVQKFQEAEKKLGGQLPESLLYYGITLAELGESGIAARQLVEYLSRQNISPENRSKALNYLSECAIQLQQLNQAVEISRRILQQYPDDVDVKLTLGRALLLQIMQGRARENKEIISEAEEILRPLAAEGNKEAVEQLAQVHLFAGELEDAEELLTRHYEQNPRDAQILRLLYTVLARQRKHDKAEDKLRRALNEQPENEASEKLLAGLDGDREWEDYILELLPLALEEDTVERRLGLLELYRRAGRAEVAENMVNKLADKNPDNPRVLEEQFEQKLNEQNWEAAEKVRQRFAKAVDNELEHTLWEARLHIARGNYNEAIDLLEKELSDDTPLSEAWTILGNAYRGLGDYPKAQANLEKALERNPADNQALRYLIAVCDARGFKRQALSYMRRALHFAPNDQQLVRLFLNYLEDYESPSKALNLRLQIASRQPGNRENRRAIARLYMRTEDLESAKNVLDGLYDENPDDIQTIILMARYHALKGELDKGKATIKTYLESQDEKKASDLLQYARFLIQYGDDRAVVEEIVDEALQLESEENREASQFYASWLMGRQEYEEAREIYQSLHEDLGADRFLLSMAEADLEMGNVDKAKAVIRNYLQNNQMSASAANLKTRTHISLEEFSQARRTIDRAIELAPENVQSRMLRAELGARSPSHVSDDRVRKDLEKALEVDPENRSARRMLVSWLMKTEEEDQAITHLEELVEENPEDTEIRSLLANLYFQQDEHGKLASLLKEWQELTDDGGNTQLMQWESRLAEAQGDWDKAVDKMQRLYSNDPSADNLSRYLHMLIAADKPGKAVSVFKQSENDELKEKSSVLLQYGRALFRKGEVQEARKQFVEAIRSTDDAARRKHDLLINIRSSLDGEDVWQEFLTEDLKETDDPVISYLLAENGLRKGNTEEALDRLNSLQEALDKDDFLYSRVLIALSDTYLQMEDNEKAADLLEEVIKIEPNNPRVLNNLAYQMALLDREPYEAVELAEKALQKTSEDGEQRANILDTLGFAQFKAGLYAHAQTSYTRSIRNHPSATTYMHLGELYLDQDKPVAAKRMLDLAQDVKGEQELSDKLAADISDLMQKAEERIQQMDEEEKRAELDAEGEDLEEVEEAGRE